MVDTEAGTLPLLERHLWEVLSLLAIPATHHWIGLKELERLVVKLCSMHLAVPGAAVHL